MKLTPYAIMSWLAGRLARALGRPLLVAAVLAGCAAPLSRPFGVLSPTPSPFAHAMERARQWLGEEHGMPPHELRPEMHGICMYPESGRKVWAGTFMGTSRPGRYAAMVEADGRVGPPPSLEREALAAAAQTALIPADELVVAKTELHVLPFTKQCAVFVELSNTTGMYNGGVVIDLDGHPVDRLSLLAQEDRTARDRCGRLDRQLCQQAMEAPQEIIGAVVYLRAGAGGEGVQKQIEDAGYTWQRGPGDTIMTHVPAHLAFRLALLPEVVGITSSLPPTTTPA